MGSEYLNSEVHLGTKNNQGIRNEDLTRLTFADENIDCILSLLTALNISPTTIERSGSAIEYCKKEEKCSSQYPSMRTQKPLSHEQNKQPTVRSSTSLHQSIIYINSAKGAFPSTLLAGIYWMHLSLLVSAIPTRFFSGRIRSTTMVEKIFSSPPSNKFIILLFSQQQSYHAHDLSPSQPNTTMKEPYSPRDFSGIPHT